MTDPGRPAASSSSSASSSVPPPTSTSRGSVPHFQRGPSHSSSSNHHHGHGHQQHQSHKPPPVPPSSASIPAAVAKAPTPELRPLVTTADLPPHVFHGTGNVASYEVGERLGSGTYGVVFKGVDKRTRTVRTLSLSAVAC